MRRSSAVLLTRRRGERHEVFLVERAADLRFFGGYWAFPGGVVDEVDRLPGEADDAAALERCALRELFEETGVLAAALARAIPAGRRHALREALLDRGTDAGAWAEFVEAADEARSALRTVTTITTPPFAPVRHETPFLHLELPEGEEPEVLEGELVRGRFFEPEQVLEEWTAGALDVAPPVLYLLDLMRGAGLEEFLERARLMGERLAGGELHRACFAPGTMTAPLRTPTLPPATTTNCVLVGEERVWIVDPATYEEAERARLFETLDRKVAGGAELAGVLLTHHHHDHVGSAEAVARRFGLEVHAHPETLSRVDLGGQRGVPLLDGETRDLGAAPDGTPGWHLTAHETPGHAHGHLVFIDSRYRTAVVGDLVSTLSTIVIDPPEGHMATYIASLRRVLELDIGVLIPAHGVPQRVGADTLRYHIARREQREAKLVAALEGGGCTEGELLPVVYDDAPEPIRPLAARSLLAGLEKLAEEGRARLEGDRWTLSGGA
jgi:glyoxylase-like metal-dependent hydrolase (beta-lactamase superfamily II)/8-oxo-dGTP pyrophosphatase MutT (NUDIX family)